MLKKIRVDEVRLGMHLHALCGSWLDHPFWKSKFVLRASQDLASLRGSNVTECWIDTAKGLDVAPADVSPAAAAEPDVAAAPTPEAAPEPEPEPQTAVSAPAASAAPSKAATSMAEETLNAAALVNEARVAVQSLLGEARMGRTVNAEPCVALVGEITASVWRNPGAMVSLARLKTHDDYSYMHSVAVCALMVALARQLGQTEDQAREAGMAGLLHDIGKAMMPVALLNKPEKLTASEYALIRTHPERGHELLLTGSQVPAAALDVCLHHHERPDGKGYPFGMRGDALSTIARMGALCDVYDAITSNRPYKGGWDPAESIALMAEWTKAGQFDNTLFQVFVKSLGIYPVGSLVRLKSGRLAVVVEQNVGALTKPRVRAFFSTHTRSAVPVESIDLSDADCSDRIANRESNSQWKFKHLDELWAGPEALARMGRAA